MFKCKKYFILRYIFLVCVGMIHLTSCSDYKDLSPKQAKAGLKEMTGFELPENAENLRGFYPCIGRDPHFFIKFETDPEGMAEVVKAFGGPGAEITQLNEDDFERRKERGTKLFYYLSNWQEKIGIKLFDEESFKVGILLEHGQNRRRKNASYEIFIDNINNIVYIHAWQK